MTPLAKILWLAVAAGFVFVVVWLLDDGNTFVSKHKDELDLHLKHLNDLNPRGKR